MNFEKLNTIAKGDQRTVKKIADLQLNRLYEIEHIRKSHTTNYGDKVVIDITDEKNEKVYCYLPKRVGESLLANGGEELKEFQSQMEVGTIRIRRLEGRWNPVQFVSEFPDAENSEVKK